MEISEKHIGIREYIRALRLPFTTASILPFIAGSLIDKEIFDIVSFFLGFICVVAVHLGANLINDYADSKSGADWQDKKFYTFFGGSKLIQEGVLSQKFYLFSGLFCFFLSSVCILLLGAKLSSLSIFGFYFLILFLGFSYSHKPLQFSYHRLGELIIFTLFGPALVMGAYFIQTLSFPTLEGFMLSLPFGFLTTAILFANEIPDYQEDINAGKYTWVSLVGQKKAFLIYYLLIFLGFASIIANIGLGYLGLLSLLSFALIFPAQRAAKILRFDWADKLKLVESSKLTIAIHAGAGVVLILDLLL